MRNVQRGDSGEYTITATNSSGRDSVTVTVTVTDKPSAPEGPLQVSDIHNEGCKLKWKRPKDDGGVPISYYQVEKQDPQTGIWVPCGRANETAAEVNGLTPGKEYKFRVMAVNTEGESEPLETLQPILAKNPFDEPGKPTDVVPTDWDKDHVDLKWTAPTVDGGSPITSYIVEKKDKYGDWEKAAEVPASQTNARAPGLIEGQAYEFRVRAVNAAGPGEPSDATLPIVAKPRNLAPKIDRSTLVPVKIKAGQSFSYDVNVSGEPAPTTKWALRSKEVKAADHIKITAVDYNTKLQVRMATRADSGVYTISAENVNGKDSADVDVIVIDKPGTPGGPLKASNVHADGLTLDWNPPVDDGGIPVDHYLVEKMDEATGRWVPAGQTTGPKTKFDVDGLTPGHKYKFRVRAVNKQGKSDPLTTAQAIEAKNPFEEPGKPGMPEITDYDSDFVQLAWKRPETDGGSPITGYVIEKKDKFSGAWEPCCEVEGDVNSGRVGDLIEGVQYEFRVKAVNRGGPGVPSDPTLPHIARPKNLPPKIDRALLGDIKIRAGQTFDLDANVIGEPPPRKEWTARNQVLMSDSRIRLTVEDYSIKLRVMDTKRSDTGVYTLTATNINGQDTATVKVTILDVPSAPEGPLSIMDMTKSGCNLHWRAPKDDGGSDVTHYIVEKQDAENMRWITVGDCKGTSMRVPLLENHDYKFRVRAVNRQGESLPLNTTSTVTAKDPYERPDKPGAPEPTDWDKNHVDLQWTPPKKDCGTPVTGYIIEKRSKFGIWEKAVEVAGSQTKARVPDLTEGEEYEFRVTAVNKAGVGDPSDASAPIIARARFLAPQLDKSFLEDLVVRAGQRIAYNLPYQAAPKPTVRWQVNGKAVNPEDSRVHMATYERQILFEIPFSLRSDTGKYTVTLENNLGNVSATANVTVLDRPSAPEGPLLVSNVKKDGCVLSWRSPLDDGGAPITHYIIEKMDTSRGTWAESAVASSTTCEVTKLVHMKEYYFRVKAVNSIGESDPLATANSIIAKNAFDEPDAPGRPNVVDWDSNYIDLEWKPPANDGGSPVIGYVIQKKEKGSPFWQNAAQVNGKECKGRAPELVEGTEYEFRIIAINAAGNSQPSEPSDLVMARPRHLAPKIKTPLREIRIKAGTIFHVDINYVGEPSPDVEWTCDGRQLKTDERATITAIGYHTIVHIVNTKRSDSGELHLRLSNESGTDEGSFLLVVMDRPGPPTGPLEYEEITSSSVTLSWKPPKDQGGSDITAYVIEKRDLTHGGGWVPAVNYVDPRYTHATVPRLMEGTKYEFRVMAENVQGRSDPLDTDKPIVAKNQYDVPGRPGRPDALDTDKDHIKIRWSPPHSNGGSPIVGYDVERRDLRGGRWIKVNRDPVRLNEFNDDKVQDGHQYEYRVIAINAAGPGKSSEASHPFTAKPMREKPRLHLDKLNSRRIKVKAGEPINVEIPLSGAPTPTVEWTKQNKAISDNRIVTDTQNDRTKLYVSSSKRTDAGKYQVSAHNAHGKDSAELEVLVVDKPGPPNGPLTYTNVSAEGITLNWKAPLDDGGSEITGYVIEKTDALSENWRPLPGYCPSVSFTVKTGLEDGKRYVFRVRAENAYGLSEPLTGKPVAAKSPFDPPDAPDQPKIVSYTPNSCTLLWDPPAFTGGRPVTGYYIEKRDRGGEWLRVNQYPTPNTTHMVTNLTEGNRYEFRIVAVNDAGPGKPSRSTEPLVARIQKFAPDAPDAPKLDRVFRNSVALSWRPPLNDGGMRIKGYNVEKKLKSATEWEEANSLLVTETNYTVSLVDWTFSLYYRLLIAYHFLVVDAGFRLG